MNFSSFVSVIVLILNFKFKVSLLSFLFMLLFWSLQSKFMVSHACFGMSLHLKIGVSPKIFTTKFFYFLLTFTFLSTSIIFFFILFCPLLSLSLSLPLSLAAAVTDWVMCPFLLCFCFLTNIVFLSYIYFVKNVIFTT